MVKTDRMHTYAWFKALVEKFDIRVRDVQRMRTEIDMEAIYEEEYANIHTR